LKFGEAFSFTITGIVAARYGKELAGQQRSGENPLSSLRDGIVTTIIYNNSQRTHQRTRLAADVPSL